MEYKSANNLFDKSDRQTTTADNEKVRTRINFCLQQAENGGLNLTGMKPIYIRGTLFGGSTAGLLTSRRDGFYLSIHPPLIAKYGDAYIKQTVGHEVAHAIAKHVSPGCTAHGFEWQRVMHILGLTADRCSGYEMPAKNRMARPYIYKCICKDKQHKLTHILHNRIREGRWRTCKRCRTQIEFVKVA